jgi:hypothetical protein
MIPFSMRQANGSILMSRVKPTETAFENRLYSYEKVPVAQRQALEKTFFGQEIDDRAAPVLVKLCEGDVTNLSVKERIDWTRFLIASRLRVPEIVNDLRKAGSAELRRSLTEDHDEYLAIKDDDDAPTLLEWTEHKFVGLTDNFGMMILPSVITDPKHAKLIDTMHWWLEDVSVANVELLTSDRPLWVSTGLKNPNCLLALPLTPTRIFFASNNRDHQMTLHTQGANRLVRRCNESIASQANRFVYGTAKIKFIDRRLGRDK